MILTLIILVLFGIVNAVVYLLPTGGLPTAVSSAFSSIIGYMYVVNGFFPVDTFIYLAGLALVLEGFVILWNLGHMVLRYFRGN